jgi:hypothetical protein
VSGFGDLLALAANVESVARAMRDLRSTVVALFDVNEGESSSLAVTYGDGLDYWDVLSESEYACLVACLVHAGRPAPMDVSARTSTTTITTTSSTISKVRRVGSTTGAAGAWSFPACGWRRWPCGCCVGRRLFAWRLP